MKEKEKKKDSLKTKAKKFIKKNTTKKALLKHVGGAVRRSLKAKVGPRNNTGRPRSKVSASAKFKLKYRSKADREKAKAKKQSN